MMRSEGKREESERVGREHEVDSLCGIRNRLRSLGNFLIFIQMERNINCVCASWTYSAIPCTLMIFIST